MKDARRLESILALLLCFDLKARRMKQKEKKRLNKGSRGREERVKGQRHVRKTTDKDKGRETFKGDARFISP